MHHLTTTLLAAGNPPDTKNLAHWLQVVFGPLFLSIVGIVCIFFLFTREVTRFVQFLVLAIGIAIIFYVPGSIETIARSIATALGFKGSSTG